MEDPSLAIFALIILLVSAFFSGMEIAFVSSSKFRFEMDREEQGFTAHLIDTFYRHPNNFISTLLVGNNIALVIYGILMAKLINTLILVPLGVHTEPDCPHEWICLLTQTLLGTLLVLVAGEFLPKTLFRLNPNRMMRIFALPAYFFYIVLWPISKFTSSLSKWVLRTLGMRVEHGKQEKSFSKVDLDYLIQSNIENIENDEEIEDEVKIFQNALDFSNVKVRDCIVPRTEIDAVDEKTELQVLKNHFVESGHSKIVVYREDIDNIVGYIHSSEMFRLGEKDDWTKCIREASIVPETMNAQKLLGIFISQKRSLAVVVDEFGGTSGIVTLEDLVEEIFGDIEDEHDKDNYTAKNIAPGEYILSARLEIEKVNELFDLDLPESDEYLTVGGLILHQFQNFPKLNEIVKFGRWEFKILQNTTTKIELVKLKVTE
ncbi:MAG: HlyC/CorC family transporter [Bacteroidaceae bacterium]|nr:HlyC/CorC family transporter [Bacteroidaceae bacterium]MBQ2460010.1 HlyC/CorC family transporter [Bacteroidaceae bacterium]